MSELVSVWQYLVVSLVWPQPGQGSLMLFMYRRIFLYLCTTFFLISVAISILFHCMPVLTNLWVSIWFCVPGCVHGLRWLFLFRFLEEIRSLCLCYFRYLGTLSKSVKLDWDVARIRGCIVCWCRRCVSIVEWYLVFLSLVPESYWHTNDDDEGGRLFFLPHIECDL